MPKINDRLSKFIKAGLLISDVNKYDPGRTYELARKKPRIFARLVRGFHMLIDIESEKLQQVVAEISFPAGFCRIPWGHYCLVITKCKDIYEALFYLRRTVERGLSRNALFEGKNRL